MRPSAVPRARFGTSSRRTRATMPAVGGHGRGPDQHWPIFGTQTPTQPPPKGRHAPTQHLPGPQQSESVTAPLASRLPEAARTTGLDWDGNLISISSGRDRPGTPGPFPPCPSWGPMRIAPAATRSFHRQSMQELAPKEAKHAMHACGPAAHVTAHVATATAQAAFLKMLQPDDSNPLPKGLVLGPRMTDGD